MFPFCHCEYIKKTKKTKIKPHFLKKMTGVHCHMMTYVPFQTRSLYISSTHVLQRTNSSVWAQKSKRATHWWVPAEADWKKYYVKSPQPH